MLQFNFSLRQFGLIKCSFFIHCITPYIHPRLYSRNVGKISNYVYSVNRLFPGRIYFYFLEHGVKLNCRCKGSSAMSTFIYPNGDIPGAMIFWYDKPVREIFTISYSYKGDTR